MKILVAIASYGQKNDAYLSRVLSEYRSMPYQADIVMLSNISRDLGRGVEVITGLPDSNPSSLPSGHMIRRAFRTSAGTRKDSAGPPIFEFLSRKI